MKTAIQERERKAYRRGPLPLERLKLKDHCEMCGDKDKGSRHRAHLEPAFNPDGKPMTLCRPCRIGSAEALADRRFQLPSREIAFIIDVLRYALVSVYRGVAGCAIVENCDVDIVDIDNLEEALATNAVR